MSGGPSRFEPAHIEVFMGGDFVLGQPRTVGELRQALREFEVELSGWGDDREISEVHVHNEKIRVTLREGIPQ